MNYQEMSDFEINKAVSMAIYGRTHFTKGKNPEVLKGFTVFNPCNSWADAGPIIQKNGINLMASKVVDSGGLKEWEAMSYEGNCHHWGELNPLRAAMIVFLMMKDKENEQV